MADAIEELFLEILDADTKPEPATEEDLERECLNEEVLHGEALVEEVLIEETLAKEALEKEQKEDEERKADIEAKRSLAKIKLTKEEKLNVIAEHLGLNACDFAGEEDDAFLTQVVLEYKVILGLYMTGRSATDIARYVETTAYRVNKVLSSPQNLNIITHWRDSVLIELDGLLPLVIDAVRKGLNSGDAKLRLLAVDRYVKLKGEGEDRTGMTVNIVNNSRTDFLESLTDLASKRGLIEGETKEVKDAIT